MAIHIEEEALKNLRAALETAGEDYKSKYARLKSLMNEITSGDIQGEPANDLLAKFQAKEEMLNKVAQTIDEAEAYMGMQTSKFTSLIGEMSSQMK